MPYRQTLHTRRDVASYVHQITEIITFVFTFIRCLSKLQMQKTKHETEQQNSNKKSLKLQHVGLKFYLVT